MRATETLFIEKGQYYVQHVGAVPPPAPPAGTAADGTVLYPGSTFHDGGVFVAPGTFDGPLSLTLETGDDVTEQDPSGWELVNDVDMVAKGADLVVVATGEVYDEFGRFELSPGDGFHVRLHVRGYQAGRSAHMLDPDDEPVEFHLVQVWRT